MRPSPMLLRVCLSLLSTIHKEPSSLSERTIDVGASLVRDDVDTNLVQQVLSYGKDGALISDEDDFGGVGDLDGGSTPTDTDGDGIPDDVEADLGTDPNVKDSTEIDSDTGYSWLEVWANSLVPASYASQANSTSTRR